MIQKRLIYKNKYLSYQKLLLKRAYIARVLPITRSDAIFREDFSSFCISLTHKECAVSIFRLLYCKKCYTQYIIKKITYILYDMKRRRSHKYGGETKMAWMFCITEIDKSPSWYIVTKLKHLKKNINKNFVF